MGSEGAGPEEWGRRGGAWYTRRLKAQDSRHRHRHCAEHRTMGPVQWPEELCPPHPPWPPTAGSPIPSPSAGPHTAPPLCTPIGREVIGGDGASGCTSRLHPLPPREAVVTRCYMQPRHLNAITSALHALVPFPRVLLKGGGEGGAVGGTLSFHEAFASPRTDHNRSD